MTTLLLNVKPQRLPKLPEDLVHQDQEDLVHPDPEDLVHLVHLVHLIPAEVPPVKLAM